MKATPLIIALLLSTSVFAQVNYINEKLDKFESITYASPRIDAMMGGVGNMLGGNASDYNHNGGGMKFEVMFFGKKGWGIGAEIIIHNNKKKQEYPIDTPLSQNSFRSTSFVGVGISRLFKEGSRGGHFVLQFEPALMIQNVAGMDQNTDHKPVQSFGLSPGVILNYNAPIGKGKLTSYHMSLSTIRQYLSFHMGARPMFFNSSYASGMLVEAGISYRLVMRYVTDFKLKQ